MALAPLAARVTPPLPGGVSASGLSRPSSRSRGMPIRGASAQDLDFYATGARRTLADPGKARFHDKERALLTAIEAEQATTGGWRWTRRRSHLLPEEEQFLRPDVPGALPCSTSLRSPGSMARSAC